ncbi:MAG TPA: nucleotide sugar dehydrogenase [Saprospiraceae bacterium]|nr:nucleotide sugar dehydrogenase [Saprospiraceae bacterium]HMQ83749.1 nucleotide sugar dehydrogenase [Saprospiraceae bacterium]
MLQDLLKKDKAISVTGLGYVGLPIALEFAKQFRVIGFDINERRVEMMKAGIDPSNELPKAAFEAKDILFTADPAVLKEAHFHIVAVPTPVDEYKVPDLNPLYQAATTIGRALKPGDCVVFESTVYPGCTEEDCLPLLEKHSGLHLGDFSIGYSPERINPGDREHTVDKVKKVVSGNDEAATKLIASVYGSIVKAGVYKAPSIKVAEAAKVIENAQRDINISFMNELAMIFDRMGIDTQEVLDTAATKWNFLRFTPGLVGGHCIGVDPYYLTHKAKQLGYDPEVILSGRRINDSIPGFIAKRLVQTLIQKGKNPRFTKVLVMGITFKENVSDIRNSKVVDMVKELMQYSVNVHITDPFASPNEVAKEYNMTLVDQPSEGYDAVIVAVGHKAYRELNIAYFRTLMNEHPILFDIKGLFEKTNDENFTYWRL